MVWCFFTLLTTWSEEEAHIESQQVKIAMKYCLVVTTFLLLGVIGKRLSTQLQGMISI